MICLRGSAALSQFRIEKIQEKLGQTSPNIKHLYAEFRHFSWVENELENELDSQKQEILKQILTYGPTMQVEDPQGEFLLVVPRIGTISPWASRATDIVQHCGLPEIQRVERGIAYYVQTKNGLTLTEAERQQLLPLIHDRMTETVFANLYDAEKLYHTDTPVALSTIDVLHGGKAELVKANSELGLALSPDEVDYLFKSRWPNTPAGAGGAMPRCRPAPCAMARSFTPADWCVRVATRP